MTLSNHKGSSEMVNCCTSRTSLEKILILCTTLLLSVCLLLLILFLVLPLASNNQPINICNTSTCIAQASQVFQKVDPNINPCENFYQFACGRLLKNAHGDEKLAPFFIIQENVKHQIRELYSGPIEVDDHRVVKIAKLLYKTCLNSSKTIDKYDLSIIKDMLVRVGGWPVVEGFRWRNSNFEWRETIYTFRKLGYYYSSLLELSIDSDPENRNKFLFKISVPRVKNLDQYKTVEEKLEVLVNTAKIFGAKQETALIEMTELYDFVFELQKISSKHLNNASYEKLTVTELQNKYNIINWLEFLNNIVGPTIKLYKDDHILFPLNPSMDHWFKFLEEIPKKTVANYIIWKAIEDVLPYSPNLQQENEAANDSRSEFCVQQIRNRFRPSPIDVLYLREYLPLQKTNKVRKIIENIKLELMNILYQSNFINGKEKLVAMERIKQMTEIIGTSENYFEDEILDDLDVDMFTPNGSSFLELILQANRNYRSWKYNKIYSNRFEWSNKQWDLQSGSVIGDYFYETNEIFLPATVLQGVIFDEKRPDYENYGSFGIVMGHYFMQMFGNPTTIIDKNGHLIDNWSPEFKTLFPIQARCFYDQLKSLNISKLHTSDLLLYQSLTLKAAYEAYKKLSILDEKNKTDVSLIKYTETQLFWISAASYFCQPSNSYSEILSTFEERQLSSMLVYELMINNKEFAKDFKCPLETKMNPVVKCVNF